MSTSHPFSRPTLPTCTFNLCSTIQHKLPWTLLRWSGARTRSRSWTGPWARPWVRALSITTASRRGAMMAFILWKRNNVLPSIFISNIKWLHKSRSSSSANLKRACTEIDQVRIIHVINTIHVINIIVGKNFSRLKKIVSSGHKGCWPGDIIIQCMHKVFTLCI